jgi:hypothetical protein
VILFDVTLSQVIKQFAPPRDHFKQSSSGVIVLVMNLEMLRQLVDALRQQCDLDLR